MQRHRQNPNVRIFYQSLLVGLLSLVFLTITAPAADGPWDVARLQQVPHAEWGPATQPTREVYFEGEPLAGKPTRVFGYYSRPDGPGKFPAVVLLHGGGGKAFASWTQHWAGRGYAALAIDLAGNGPAGRLADGSPPMTDDEIFRDFKPGDEKSMWTYHAVAAAIRAHSLLLSLPEVDAKRTALTGISWGGYLTCIVAGLDHRYQAAVPVYGCGFIHENSHWVGPWFDQMTADRRNRWVQAFDPSRYLGQVRTPMLFVNGTCDFAYPLDSYQKSYRLPKAPVTLCVIINRPHGHYWNVKEVDAFIDSYLTQGKPLTKIGKAQVAGNKLTANLPAPVPGATAQLDYTTATGPWQQRAWQSVPAELTATAVSAPLPAARPLTCYLRVTDERGLTVSSDHVELPAKTN